MIANGWQYSQFGKSEIGNVIDCTTGPYGVLAFEWAVSLVWRRLRIWPRECVFINASVKHPWVANASIAEMRPVLVRTAPVAYARIHLLMGTAVVLVQGASEEA